VSDREASHYTETSPPFVAAALYASQEEDLRDHISFSSLELKRLLKVGPKIKRVDEACKDVFNGIRRFSWADSPFSTVAAAAATTTRCR